MLPTISVKYENVVAIKTSAPAATPDGAPWGEFRMEKMRILALDS